MIVVAAPGQGSQTPGFLAPWLDVPGVKDRLEWLSDEHEVEIPLDRAKADGRWDAAYRVKDAPVPDDLRAALDASPKAAEFWQDVLADHIRNQHRKRVGAQCFIQRWNRTAPEQVVTITEVAA